MSIISIAYCTLWLLLSELFIGERFLEGCSFCCYSQHIVYDVANESLTSYKLLERPHQKHTIFNTVKFNTFNLKLWIHTK